PLGFVANIGPPLSPKHGLLPSEPAHRSLAGTKKLGERSANTDEQVASSINGSDSERARFEGRPLGLSLIPSFFVKPHPAMVTVTPPAVSAASVAAATV